MNDNKRLVYIVWKIDEDNYGGSNWWPIAVCEERYEAENYVMVHENDYDAVVMYTTAYVPAPLEEEAQ